MFGKKIPKFSPKTLLDYLVGLAETAETIKATNVGELPYLTRALVLSEKPANPDYIDVHRVVLAVDGSTTSISSTTTPEGIEFVHMYYTIGGDALEKCMAYAEKVQRPVVLSSKHVQANPCIVFPNNEIVAVKCGFDALPSCSDVVKAYNTRMLGLAELCAKKAPATEIATTQAAVETVGPKDVYRNSESTAKY